MKVDWAGVLANCPLSHKQLDYVCNSDAFVNLADGAVRGGKSMSGLLRWLIFIANAPRKGDLIVTAKTFDTAVRNVFNPLREHAVFGDFANSVSYTRGAPTATILGRTIEVITFNDERSEGRLRGMTAAGAYVDEWSLMPESFHQQLMARHSVDGAQLFGNTNPDNPLHWLKKEIDASKAGGRLDGDWKVWKFFLEDNPTLSEATRDRYRRMYTGLWYRRMILGEWCLAEGAIYESWDPDKHIVKKLPTIVRWISLGVDYGTTNPFVGLVLGVGADGNLYLTREWRWDSKLRQRQLTDADYSLRLLNWAREGEGGIPEWVCVDPSAASFRRQLQVDGLISHPADNNVLDGIRMVASLLAQGVLYVHESCEGWIEEVVGYTWDPDKALEGLDEPLKVNDHSMDAGRYAIKTPEIIWRGMLRQDVELAA